MLVVCIEFYCPNQYLINYKIIYMIVISHGVFMYLREYVKVNNAMDIKPH